MTNDHTDNTPVTETSSTATLTDISSTEAKSNNYRKKYASTSELQKAKEEQIAERVQKIIAQAGIVSRRDAEELIREGQVTINGKTANLGDKATLGVDAIKVKGKLIHNAETKVYYLIYKPKNVIAMIANDEEGRPTLKDFTQRIKERVFTVGRMDFTGEGAILLTNDGGLAQKLQKATNVIRRYQVKVDRIPTSEELARIARGGRIENMSMNPTHVRLVETYARNALIELSFEGMGSIEIKKFFENKRFFPEKIARVGIGHLSVEGMLPGDIKRVEASSINALLDQPELAIKQIEKLVKKRAPNTRVVTTTPKAGGFMSAGPVITPVGEAPVSAPRPITRGDRKSDRPSERPSHNGGTGRSYSDRAPRPTMSRGGGRSFEKTGERSSGRSDAPRSYPGRGRTEDAAPESTRNTAGAKLFGGARNGMRAAPRAAATTEGRSYGGHAGARDGGREGGRSSFGASRDGVATSRFERSERPAGRSFSRTSEGGKTTERSLSFAAARGAPSANQASVRFKR